MRIPYLYLTIMLLWCSIFACTPKVVQEVSTTETTVVPPPVEENLSPCPKFQDAPNPDQVETDYVLYRDAIRIDDYEEAYRLWQKVYAVAPAADGRRNTVYSDGIFLHEYFMSQETDSLKRMEYVEKVFDIYDAIENCYPEGGYIKARKAFDYFYKYPQLKSKQEVYDLFKAAIEQDGSKTPDFVINPFTALLVDLYVEGAIDSTEAKKYEQQIRTLLADGIANCKGADCERWEIIAAYTPERLRAFETVKGFYSCDYYKTQYLNDFLTAPEDCDTIRLVYSRLRWGNCPNEDPDVAQVIAAGNNLCVEKGPTLIQEAYVCLQNAQYSCAMEKFEQAAKETDDVEKKGRYLLLVAKIHYAHLRNFPAARTWARKAAAARSGWGEPYILIGKLYASSGPLCGSGRGWNSQIVTWPAIDMWTKAKRIDASVASEANKNIRRYTQYMPSKEDIFQRGLQKGQTFRVGCWIQETTTIRPAP
ncbi:MAG: hypothetical protein AAF738_01740 [Bacteroidota bacterium]